MRQYYHYVDHHEFDKAVELFTEDVTWKVMGLERVKLEANGIVVEPAARQACPPDRVLALLDPLLSRTALIVERNHPLGGAAQVGDNEPDPRVQLTRMPLELGDDAAGLVPGSGLITEAGMIPAHVLGRPADGAYVDAPCSASRNLNNS